MATMEALNRMVKMAGHAFYKDIPLKVEAEDQTRSAHSDDYGIGVVVLDALTRRQWVREDDLAKALNINTEKLHVLKFFEEQKLVRRGHQKSPKEINLSATSGDVEPFTQGGQKAKTHIYCCLDYEQVYDVARYQIHRMKKKLKDELDNKEVQHYQCPNCKRRYSAFEALHLLSDMGDCFQCEHCKKRSSS